MSSSQTITFLFTDIEGSTRLWDRWPSEMREALAIHDALMLRVINQHGGHLFKNVGDGVYAAFKSATSAVSAAIDVQRSIQTVVWPNAVMIRVRAALHTGEAQLRDGDYFGLTLSRTARLLQAGHGGQILCSDATEQFLRHDISDDVTVHPLGEVRLKSLQRPELVYQINANGLQDRFPSLLSLESYVHNLPVQLNSFIGREKESSEIRNALLTNRLVTVTGPGGSGKTRLALQVGADLLDAFDRGVWLVELAAVNEPEYVTSAIAKVLSVREEPGCTMIESIIRSYSGGKVLIVLDNCEHLIEAVATLTHTLLQSCLNVKILATSRERLHVPGEFLVPLPPMPLPRRDGKITAVELLSHDCARLFVERATAVQPTFRLTDNNAHSLMQICNSLDGIPLALELAAARSSILSLDRMASRLTDRFRILSGGNRTAAARQQTLEATIDWSYDLLTEQERMLLLRLAVFTGTWTLEAAEVVCEGDGLEDWQVLDLLSALINKSLVTVESAESVRYRLLESLRSYCLNKLNPQDLIGLKHKHADWCLSLVSEEKTVGEVAYLTALNDEIDNIRAAIDFSCTDDPVANIKLTKGMYTYWYSRGHLSEGASSCASSLKCVEAFVGTGSETEEVRMMRSKLLGNLAIFQWATGNLAAAENTIQLSMAVCLEMGDEEGVAANMNNLALLANNRGDYKAADDLNELALNYYRRVGDDSHVAICLTNMSSSFLDRRDYDQAETHLSEAMSLYKATENLHGQASVYCNLCEIHYHRLEFQQAYDDARSGLELAAITGDRVCQVILFELLGASLVQLENARKAAVLLAAAESARRILAMSREELQQKFYSNAINEVKNILSVAEFEELSRQGQSLPIDEVIRMANG